MSPAALRWSAVPLGLLAYALNVATGFWLPPYTQQQSAVSSRLLLVMGASFAAVSIPLLIFVLICRTMGRPPARLIVRRGTFVAGPTPAYAGIQAIVFMFLGGGAVVTERTPQGAAMRLAQDDYAWPAMIIVTGLFWTIGAAFLLIQRPQLRLDRDGLTIFRLRSVTRLGWDDLAPGGPPSQLPRRQPHLTVRLARPPQFGQAGVNIPVKWLHVDPAFLADTVRHYVEHPDDRAAIGAEPELARLRQTAEHPSSAITPI